MVAVNYLTRPDLRITLNRILNMIKKIQTFYATLTNKQVTESGLVLAALLLLCKLLFSFSDRFEVGALVILGILMVKPGIFRPFAFFWFGGSLLIGHCVSKVLLTFIFFGIVFPIGLIRRLAGIDAMMIRSWQSCPSGFILRNHTFKPDDLKTIY